MYIYSCCWFNIHIYFLKTFLHVYIDKICKPGQCIPKTDTITTTFTFYFYFWLKNVKSGSSSFVESESKTEFQFPRDERKRHGTNFLRRYITSGGIVVVVVLVDWLVTVTALESFFGNKLEFLFISFIPFFYSLQINPLVLLLVLEEN